MRDLGRHPLPLQDNKASTPQTCGIDCDESHTSLPPNQLGASRQRRPAEARNIHRENPAYPRVLRASKDSVILETRVLGKPPDQLDARSAFSKQHPQKSVKDGNASSSVV